MSVNLPNNYSSLFSEEEIKKKILEIAPRIKTWVLEQRQATGKDPIALCVLRGAVYFFSDLTRAIGESVDLEFIKYNTYDEKTNTQLPEDKLPSLNLGVELNDRSVLIIDDICETGRLLDILKKECIKKGSKAVQTAVLVYRDKPSSVTLPDYYCFLLKEEDWLVGYGLDDQERFRNLPCVYKMVLPNV